jgi:hypothetical protein
MNPSRSRSLLAALATFSAILLQPPAQAKPPAKPATPPGPLPACLLTLEVRQLHWTLDPLEIAKDHINALQFDLPADPAFCKDVTVGTLLDEKFRWGSWLFRQNYGQWSVRVVGKRINGVPEATTVPVPQASTVPPPTVPSAVTPAPAANAPATPTRPSTAPYDPGPAPALEPVLKPTGEAKSP